MVVAAVVVVAVVAVPAAVVAPKQAPPSVQQFGHLLPFCVLVQVEVVGLAAGQVARDLDLGTMGQDFVLVVWPQRTVQMQMCWPGWTFVSLCCEVRRQDLVREEVCFGLTQRIELRVMVLGALPHCLKLLLPRPVALVVGRCSHHHVGILGMVVLRHAHREPAGC